MNLNEFADDCYQKIRDGVLLLQKKDKKKSLQKLMRDILDAICQKGLEEYAQSFGNLFFRIDFLCKAYHLYGADKYAVQSVRVHSNMAEADLNTKILLGDFATLLFLVELTTKTEIPVDLLGVREKYHPQIPKNLHVDISYVRCVVGGWNDRYVLATERNTSKTIKFTYSNAQREWNFGYLRDILCVGMQLNLLNCQEEDGVLSPEFVVVEPDFLLEVSALAACFADYGHHPVSFLLNRFKQRTISQPILLGNFASMALDDIIHLPRHVKYDVNASINGIFRDKTLEFVACPNFDSEKFLLDARNQARNIDQMIDTLFINAKTKRERAILEPSFICEALGIQGRVDLMTTDFKLLAEQKSGKNFYIEHKSGTDDIRNIETHFVQLLLYFGFCRFNFDQIPSCYLLYSKYTPDNGTVYVKYVGSMLAEVMKFRNEVVSYHFRIAQEGFERFLPLFSPEVLNERHIDSIFFRNYQLPEIEQLTMPMQKCETLENKYFCGMFSFVISEMLYSKVGKEDGLSGCVADLWNMPLAKKIESGNILFGLTILKKEKTLETNGYDTLTLHIPDQGENTMPNFRIGDMVYLYSYVDGGMPDVRNSLLYSSYIQSISTDTIVIHLGDGQENSNIFEYKSNIFAIEHAFSDASSNASIRGLHAFLSAPTDRSNLFLGMRAPTLDKNVHLSKSYDSDYDPILEKIKQSKDYFLLIGPPGTGKTHRAIRFILEEELHCSDASCVLLLAYTNRAVDELCEMLESANISFLRMGIYYSCDKRFRKHLVSRSLCDDGEKIEMSGVVSRLRNFRVVVSTVAYLSSKPYIFNIKHFSLAIVDEASQILESQLVGIFNSHYADKQKCDIDKFVFVGDYKQMPPVFSQPKSNAFVRDENLHNAGFENFADSLFLRLIKQERRFGRTEFMATLFKQGRMHPKLAEFPNRFFYFNERIQSVGLDHQIRSELPYRHECIGELAFFLKNKRLIYIPSACDGMDVSSDKINEEEAKIVGRVVVAIYNLVGEEEFDTTKTLGVIVPYRNQIAMIRKELSATGIDALKSLVVDTVERFQGSQFDVIIYSFTIRHIYQLDFLTQSNFVDPLDNTKREIDPKLNVAITRAREQLIVIGNETLLRKNSIYTSFIDFVKEQGGYYGN